VAISSGQLRTTPQFPHHVALPAEKVSGLKNSELVRSVAASFIGSDFVVFCVAEPEDAETFAKRFDGELYRADH
jgi:hypothetical protein